MIWYTLDGDDRVVAVAGDWDQFAKDNDGNELTEAHVLGRPLYDFLSGDDVKILYRNLLARVRQSGETLDFNIRCDAPNCRRLLKMNVQPGDDDHLVIESNLLDERPRDQRMRVLDRRALRSGGILIVCCICARVQSEDGTWVEIEDEASRRGLFEDGELSQLVHGFCPECHQAQIEQLNLELDSR